MKPPRPRRVPQSPSYFPPRNLPRTAPTVTDAAIFRTTSCSHSRLSILSFHTTSPLHLSMLFNPNRHHLTLSVYIGQFAIACSCLLIPVCARAIPSILTLSLNNCKHLHVHRLDNHGTTIHKGFPFNDPLCTFTPLYDTIHDDTLCLNRSLILPVSALSTIALRLVPQYNLFSAPKLGKGDRRPIPRVQETKIIPRLDLRTNRLSDRVFKHDPFTNL